MNPRLVTFAQWFAGAIALVVLAVVNMLAGCESSPSAGMTAARMVGETKCLEVQRYGKTETVAVFRFANRLWFYHPSTGSVSTTLPLAQAKAVYCHLVLKGVEGDSRWVSANGRNLFPLLNGCLPEAIAETHQFGGNVAMTGMHAHRIP